MSHTHAPPLFFSQCFNQREHRLLPSICNIMYKISASFPRSSTLQTVYKMKCGKRGRARKWSFCSTLWESSIEILASGFCNISSVSSATQSLFHIRPVTMVIYTLWYQSVNYLMVFGNIPRIYPSGVLGLWQKLGRSLRTKLLGTTSEHWNGGTEAL